MIRVRGAEIFALWRCAWRTHIGGCVVIRVESAVDGISKAVVATVLKSQGTNPAAAFVVLAKEALQRPLSALDSL
jgi:hypothetical protein